jgi:hypothetical protein
MGMDRMTRGIYLGNPGADRPHPSIRNTTSIFPSLWCHVHSPSIQRSKLFGWFIMAGYPLTRFSHRFPMLKQELLMLSNSYRMPCKVGQSVVERLPSGYLHYFTTPSSNTLRDALQGRHRASWEIHLEAFIVRICIATPRQQLSGIEYATAGPWSCQFEGHTRAS